MDYENEHVVHTTCASHCGGTCALEVHTKDGVISRIETDGGSEPQLRACLRGRSYRQRVYAPDRILYPLRRTGERGGTEFDRIGWDEALDTVASELTRVRDEYGPASILFLGMAGDVMYLHHPSLTSRLLSMAGGYTSIWGVTSFGAGMSAEHASYGSYFASNTRDDLLNSRLIILWGWDPATSVSGPNTSWYMAQARDSGARIVAVDPKLSDSAATFAQQWIPIYPGTDAAMLIAMAYVIINEDLQDQEFLDKYTVGFDEFKRYVLGETDGVRKSPAWAESITGVPAGVVESLAKEYATTKPSALMAGISPGRTAYGEQYHRAAITLAAMTGNVGIHGGSPAGRAWESVWGGFPYTVLKHGFGRKYIVPNPVDQAATPPGRGGTPLSHLGQKKTRVHWCDVPDFITKGKAGGFHSDCRAVYIVNCNYVTQFPNINRIVAALKMVEFIVVQEQFMTPTARFADIVLPTSTFLERNDVALGVGAAYYGNVQKVIEPLGECKSHLEIACELAQRMGISDYGTKAEEEWLGEFIEESEVPDYEHLKKAGTYRLPLSAPHVAFREQVEDLEHNPFRTPSGRIEIYSQRWADMENAELTPVPQYIESWEGRNDPLATRYPLQLITTHCRRRALSQFDNIPWLRELQPQTTSISTADASERRIRDGDLVRVFNERGETYITAKVTERIMPGVVEVPHGAWYDPDKEGADRGGCANVLCNDKYSPTGAFTYNSCLVQVERAKNQ